MVITIWPPVITAKPNAKESRPGRRRHPHTRISAPRRSRRHWRLAVLSPGWAWLPYAGPARLPASAKRILERTWAAHTPAWTLCATGKCAPSVRGQRPSARELALIKETAHPFRSQKALKCLAPPPSQNLQRPLCECPRRSGRKALKQCIAPLGRGLCARLATVRR